MTHAFPTRRYSDLDTLPLAEKALFAALAALDEHQPLNRATGGVHAAALCSADGAIRLVRENVGRHNGFDKLIGAMVRQGLAWNGGFALLSSRCSYELVEKAALSACRSEEHTSELQSLMRISYAVFCLKKKKKCNEKKH